MPYSWFMITPPYKYGTKEYYAWCKRERARRKAILDAEHKAKIASMKQKLVKYREVCQQWHDRIIDWNTYCKLSKRYYQSPSTLAAYGLSSQ